MRLNSNAGSNMKRTSQTKRVSEMKEGGFPGGKATSKVLSQSNVAADDEALISPKRRWHYRKLLALREAFLQRREGLVQEVAQPVPPYSMHMADSATDEFNQEMALSQLSTEQNALYEIEEALRRLQDGTYGLCELTGQRISEKRLKAVPWTRFTARAEKELEKQHALGSPHLGEISSVREPGEIRFAEQPEETEEGGETPMEELEKLAQAPLEDARPGEEEEEA